MVRLDRHLAEYFLFQTLWVLFKSRFTAVKRFGYAAFDTQAILDVWNGMPANVVYPERNRRQYLSGVLARNEVSRDYDYNRSLFYRISQGWYQFNPKLSVRSINPDSKLGWILVFQALNLPLIYEFSDQRLWPQVETCVKMAGMPMPSSPVSAEQAVAREEELEKMRESSREFHRQQREKDEQRIRKAQDIQRKKLQEKKQLVIEKQARAQIMKEMQRQKKEQLARDQFDIEF